MAINPQSLKLFQFLMKTYVDAFEATKSLVHRTVFTKSGGLGILALTNNYTQTN